MIEIILVILSLLVVIFGYTTFNLLRKNEDSEDVITSQDKFINDMNQYVIDSEKRLKEIDEKGSFKSDDEIGWFFDEIKKIQNGLSQFKQNQ
jgi:cell division protein FtsL